MVRIFEGNVVPYEGTTIITICFKTQYFRDEVMLSYKQFIQELDDDVSPAEAEKRYFLLTFQNALVDLVVLI